MGDLDNAKIYKKVSKTGTVADQYAVVNLDATDFCVTINGNTHSLATEFGYVWQGVNNLNDNVLWKTTSTNTYNRVYFVSADGTTQGVWGFTSDVVAGTLALRDSSGHVKVAAPNASTDAANRGYVDDHFVNLGNVDQEINGQKTFTNYLAIFDDGSEHDVATRPPKSISFGDSDLYIYSTGFTVHDADTDQIHHYSFPDRSGTFAMTNEIGLVLLDLREAA